MAFTRLVLPPPEGAEIKKRIPLVIVFLFYLSVCSYFADCSYYN
jgi:hypothetical protein